MLSTAASVCQLMFISVIDTRYLNEMLEWNVLVSPKHWMGAESWSKCWTLEFTSIDFMGASSVSVHNHCILRSERISGNLSRRVVCHILLKTLAISYLKVDFWLYDCVICVAYLNKSVLDLCLRNPYCLVLACGIRDIWELKSWITFLRHCWLLTVT